MPESLLPNISKIMNNPDGQVKPYGIDGSPVTYIKDDNKDGMVTIDKDEKAYLYIGQRRGGQQYFGFDISKPDAPKLMFAISPSSTGYSKLGLTFSTPVISKVKIKPTTGEATEKLAMIFTGGYDNKQDSKDIEKSVTDGMGNAIYIADAVTGELIWSSDKISSLSTLMTNGMPSDIAAIDLTGDGLVDHLYATDMAANVFRVDILSDGTVKGGKIASLQDDGEAVNNRRFFAGVDAALAVDGDNDQYVALAVGSGHRENPLSTKVNNHFYMLRDYGVLSKTFDETIELSKLADITDEIGDENGDGVSDAFMEVEKNKKGWYLKLTKSGEKVTTNAVIFDNSVFFTTYYPDKPVNESCSTGVAGASRFYSVSLSDGMPIKDQDGTEGLSQTDRYQELDGSPAAGMVPVQILFTEGGTVGLIGNQVVDIPDPSDTIRRVKWRHYSK